MLANQITLTVDHDHDGGTTPAIQETYDRYEEYLNRSVYVHEGHTLGAKDTLAFYRTLPKPVGSFKGMAKSAVKFSKEIMVPDSVGGEVTAPAILHLTASLPVGATSAQKLLMRQRVVALLNDDTVMNELMDKLMV